MPQTLSVMMPNWNHGHLIGRAIEAIFNQSRPPDEMIIVDDGSTDASVEVIHSYMARHPQIRLHCNPQNQGFLAVMQRLPQMVSGEYLYGASADDVVLPGFFETAMGMAEQYPQAGTVCGQFLFVDETGNELGVERIDGWHQARFATAEQFLREYLQVAPPNHALGIATIYRRQALVADGGFRLELGAFYDGFAARALGARWGTCYVPQPFAAWTLLPNSLSDTWGRAPALQLDVCARTAWLMRSPTFRERFPEAFTARWLRRQRRSIIRSAVRQALERPDSRQQSPLRPLRSRITRLLHLLTEHRPGPAAMVKAFRLWRDLRRYPGDLSCYEEPLSRSS